MKDKQSGSTDRGYKPEGTVMVTYGDQPSYHQRFRERFGGVLCANRSQAENDIFAFIDEVVAEEKEKSANENWRRGFDMSRAALIEKVEGMKPPEDPHSPYWLLGFARAKHTVLTFLRGEDNQTEV